MQYILVANEKTYRDNSWGCIVKKIFLTILFTLVLCGGSYAEDAVLESLIYKGSTKKELCKKTGSNLTGTRKTSDTIINHNSSLWCHGFNEKYYLYFPNNKTEIITIKNNNGVHFVYENVNKRMKCTNAFCKKGDGILKKIAYSKYEALAYANPDQFDDYMAKHLEEKNKIRLSKDKNKQASNNQQTQSIEFNIKQKKEQCTAIGFKPETEKFADCVLRLVELDVKQQTQNQIAVAQNNGNDALAKQLKRQSDLQSSQALINLGQQLMNPKRYNSNIYMPQTRRCTIQGFGSFANMICR